MSYVATLSNSLLLKFLEALNILSVIIPDKYSSVSLKLDQ